MLPSCQQLLNDLLRGTIPLMKTGPFPEVRSHHGRGLVKEEVMEDKTIRQAEEETGSGVLNPPFSIYAPWSAGM